MYFPLPQYRAPELLKKLASRMPERTAPVNYEPVSFPLKNMEELFASYNSGDLSGLRLIDHCRVGMALQSNLKTIMDGRPERYKELVHKYIRTDHFVDSVLQVCRQGNIFSIYLSEIFIRFEVVKQPHFEFMEKFFMKADDTTRLTGNLPLLLKIRGDKDGFLKQLAIDCLDSGQTVLEQWYYSYELPYDDYVQEHFLDQADDYLLDELLSGHRKIKSAHVEGAVKTLFDFDNAEKVKLVKRSDRAITHSSTLPQIQKPLFEHLERHLGIPPNWDLLPGISSLAVKTYETLRGLVEFQYFEVLAELIFDTQLSDEKEKTQLKNRTIFWMNYRDSISRIKIFTSSTTLGYLKQRFSFLHDKYHISNRLVDSIGVASIDSEVVFILLKDILIIEFFRGSRQHQQTCILRDGRDIFEKLSKASRLRVDDLAEIRGKADFFVRHFYLWQNAVFNFLQDVFNIQVSGEDVLMPKGENEFKSFVSVRKEKIISKKSPKITAEYGSDYKGFQKTIISPASRRVNSNIIRRSNSDRRGRRI